MEKERHYYEHIVGVQTEEEGAGKVKREKHQLRFRRFRDKMNKVNRSLKIKEGTRTRVNNELNFSNISVGDSFWVYASREEETNKSISIFN